MWTQELIRQQARVVKGQALARNLMRVRWESSRDWAQGQQQELAQVPGAERELKFGTKGNASAACMRKRAEVYDCVASSPDAFCLLRLCAQGSSCRMTGSCGSRQPSRQRGAAES